MEDIIKIAHQMNKAGNELKIAGELLSGLDLVELPDKDLQIILIQTYNRINAVHPEYQALLVTLEKKIQDRYEELIKPTNKH